jgi:hypothetical protein
MGDSPLELVILHWDHINTLAHPLVSGIPLVTVYRLSKACLFGYPLDLEPLVGDEIILTHAALMLPIWTIRLHSLYFEERLAQYHALCEFSPTLSSLDLPYQIHVPGIHRKSMQTVEEHQTL